MKQGLPQVNKYKVVILSITYNQSQYIEDTLNGFVIQQTDFPFLCCVFDDASTDGEQDVLKQWFDNHCNIENVEIYDHPLTIILMAPDKNNPNCIYAIHLHKVNLFGKPEKRELINYWRQFGEYIAMCEGDDYWLDPFKLQKQVDFMENNAEYSLCFTSAKVINESGHLNNHVNLYKDLETRDYTGEEILNKWLIPTASILYKSNLKKSPIDKRFIFGDIILFLYLAQNGKIYCINEKMVVYRRNGGGMTYRKYSYQTMVAHYEAIRDHFGENYNTIVNRLIAKAYIHGFISYKLRRQSWNILIEVNKKNQISKYFWKLFPSMLYGAIKNKLVAKFTLNK